MESKQAAPKRIWLVDSICDILFDGIKDKKLTLKQASELARLTKQRLKSLTNESAVLKFLTELSAKYTRFTTLKTMVQGMFQRNHEKQTAAQISNLIKKGQADRAIKVAKAEIR